LMMETQDKYKWNREKSLFGDFFIIQNRISF